jgi:uncharacterized protein GlcG (DUF336 family)
MSSAVSGTQRRSPRVALLFRETAVELLLVAFPGRKPSRAGVVVLGAVGLSGTTSGALR